MPSPALKDFSPAARDWFTRSFAGPTPAQEQAWPAIAGGGHVLLSAPTGSGKTLAAFLWGLDRIATDPTPQDDPRTRIVYVSPLKALSYDVERNLQGPLRGITAAGASQPPTVGIRTGDTTQRERARMRRHPPDILITTPESLYLLLTSQARETLMRVEAVIVDEIHAVAATKRGKRTDIVPTKVAHQHSNRPPFARLNQPQSFHHRIVDRDGGRLGVARRRSLRMLAQLFEKRRQHR